MNSISVASTESAEASQILQTTVLVLGNYESRMRRAIEAHCGFGTSVITNINNRADGEAVRRTGKGREAQTRNGPFRVKQIPFVPQI